MNILRKNRKSNGKLNKKIMNRLVLFIFSMVISTFAWISYTKILDTNLDLHIVAWNLEYTPTLGENNTVQFDVATLYPGMQTQIKTLTIRNNGEVTANMNYSIETLSILGTEYHADISKKNQENQQSEMLDETYLNSEVIYENGGFEAKVLNDTSRFPFEIELSGVETVEENNEIKLYIKFSWNGSEDDDDEKNQLDSKWGHDVVQYFMDNSEDAVPLSLSIKVEATQARADV